MSIVDGKSFEEILKVTESILETENKHNDLPNNTNKTSARPEADSTEKKVTKEYLSKLPKYMAKYKYKGEREKDLSVDSGTVVYVEKKNKSGWWVCITNNQRGLLPSNYLVEYKE